MYFSFIYLTEIRSIIWLTWIALFGTDTLWAGGWESKPTDLYCPVWPLHTLGGWAGISVCENMICLTLFGPDTLWVGGREPRSMKLPFLVIPVFLCLPVFIDYDSVDIHLYHLCGISPTLAHSDCSAQTRYYSTYIPFVEIKL